MSELSQPEATYQYDYIQLPEGDVKAALEEINRLGANGWMVRSFERSGGFFKILLELET
jgi:hypothetical protein